jgi:hypothetical protein
LIYKVAMERCEVKTGEPFVVLLVDPGDNLYPRMHLVLNLVGQVVAIEFDEV